MGRIGLKMFKDTIIQPKLLDTTLAKSLSDTFDNANIQLKITRKKVKNINFRLTCHLLSVSAPYYLTDNDVYTAINQRLDWILDKHQAILQKQQLHQNQPHLPMTDDKNKTDKNHIMLWGQAYPMMMNEAQRLQYYRQQLSLEIPKLFNKWQPIVGQFVSDIRIKKMRTRWGTCNTQARRIWLSVYLPAYPIQCCEYVIVHELCHLYHANHSQQFWQCVAQAMPDYQQWHDMLAGKISHHAID